MREWFNKESGKKNEREGNKKKEVDRGRDRERVKGKEVPPGLDLTGRHLHLVVAQLKKLRIH